MNYVDIISFVLAMVIVSKRSQSTMESTLGDKEWIALNTVMTLLMFLKAFSYLRAHSSLSKLVMLLQNVIVDLKEFLFLYLLVLLLNQFLNTINGIQSAKKCGPGKDEDTYCKLSYASAVFIQTFRNSLGDIETPNYGDEESENQVAWAWMIFIFSEFFLIIILLNFLIAKVTASYDDIMSK